MTMEHLELVQELTSVERMSAQDRLKQAKKRRSQQLKKWTQYEKQLEKDNSKKPKKKGVQQTSSLKKPKRSGSGRVQFAPNIALLESAARNDIDEVRRLLQLKVNPDVTNEDGLTALHQCCIDDNEEMLKLLLDNGANFNACDSELWTPLHAAATCGHVTLCKHLIDRGAELLAVNADGNMPYDICEDEVTLDYIESEMAKRGITQDQIDNTRLTTERQMLNDLRELVAMGGDLEVKDGAGATMLHIAAANGYMEVADFLLDQHVSVDSRDNESWQPIHAASYWGQLDILELLVQNGADLDSKTKNGEAPFDLSEDPEIKQRILDLKDEIETNRASRQRPGSARKLKHNSRNLNVYQSNIGKVQVAWLDADHIIHTCADMDTENMGLNPHIPKYHSVAELLNKKKKDSLPISATYPQQDSVYSSNSSLNSKTSSSASMRRSSLRGEKSNLFKKEAQEEALHFGLRLMQDTDDLGVLDEEKENVPATNLDDVTIMFDEPDTKKASHPPNPVASLAPPTNRSDQASVRLAQTNNNTVPAPAGQQGNTNNKTNAPPVIPRVPTNQDKPSPAGSNGSTFSDLKNQQSGAQEQPIKDSKKESLEDQFQKMFLETVPQIKNHTSTAMSTSSSTQNHYQPPMMEKVKNGHNNSSSTGVTINSSPNSSANASRSSFRDGQLKRFVAPPSAPFVGSEDDDDKERCCVIL